MAVSTTDSTAFCNDETWMDVASLLVLWGPTPTSHRLCYPLHERAFAINTKVQMALTPDAGQSLSHSHGRCMHMQGSEGFIFLPQGGCGGTALSTQ